MCLRFFLYKCQFLSKRLFVFCTLWLCMRVTPRCTTVRLAKNRPGWTPEVTPCTWLVSTQLWLTRMWTRNMSNTRHFPPFFFFLFYSHVRAQVHLNSSFHHCLKYPSVKVRFAVFDVGEKSKWDKSQEVKDSETLHLISQAQGRHLSPWQPAQKKGLWTM